MQDVPDVMYVAFHTEILSEYMHGCYSCHAPKKKRRKGENTPKVLLATLKCNVRHKLPYRTSCNELLSGHCFHLGGFFVWIALDTCPEEGSQHFGNLA